MYFKKPTEIAEEKTNIWKCSNDECSCWMRDQFSFEMQPMCPICRSAMIIEERMLPVLSNSI